MPEFIPNQPITFGAIAQDCLNNDPRAYAMLMQGEEQWKLQIENTSCDGAEGSVCDIDMNDVGETIVNTQFSEGNTEWATIQNVNFFPAFGYATMYYDSGTGGYSTIEKAITITPPVSTLGVLCKLTYDIVNTFIATTAKFSIAAGGTEIPVFFNGTPTTGLHSKYVFIPSDTSIFAVILDDATDGDFVTLKSITLEVVAPCWQAELDADADPTLLNVYSPAWNYSVLGGKGSFSAQPNWDFYNAQVFPLATLTVAFKTALSVGDSLFLEYTITNMTAGSIYPVLGTTAGAIRNANGTYNEYIVDDVGSSYLEFWTTADFDGTISIVEGYVYAYCHTIDVVDANTLTPVATGYVPDYVNDKIEMVFNPQSIPGEVGGEPNDFALVDGCYRIKFNDCCTGESVISDTVINYTTGTHDCTVLVDATCDGEAFGFDFSANFSIRHRLRTLRFNPNYRNEGEDSQGSDGVKRRPFAQSEKVYSCLFDYCDEPTHDAINAQLLCDTLTFDGVEYFYPIQDYSPDWADRGKLNLAQSQIELQKKQSVIFNRNCV